MYVVLILICAIFLIPLCWMIVTAFKSSYQTYNELDKFWPDPWTIQNFKDIFLTTPMLSFIKNSVIVTSTSIIGTLLSTTLAGYAFGRLKWKGRDAVFMVVLIAMMIPSQAIMIPQYMVFQKAHFINTLFPLIVPSWLAASTKGAFYIFTIRQFIMSIPHDIDEAAKIEGCGYFKIYSKILIPLLTPAIGSVIVFSFIENWNNFLSALIYLNDEAKFTLPIGIQYFQTQIFVDWNKIMGASIISVIPAIIVLFVGQKYLIKGVNLSASKG
ncbi:MAG: carbohydrate ABC transporter permease [Sphaerochaetaceae bacterium]|nr:carbohydrate ABC transporter permease [Sphaerochaetaceae bacterium]